MVRRTGFVLAFLAVGACSTQSPVAGESTRSVQLALNGERHHQTTRAGVSAWVTPAAADALEAVSTIGDSDPNTNPLSQTHFDNCYWNEGRDWILKKRQDAVVAALAYEQSGADSDRTAFFDSFGYVLHAAEDFYSHSNWVGTHEPGVLANFSDPGVQAPNGWYSGTYDNPGDTGPNAGAAHCPFGTPTHSLMNKDGPGGLGGDEAFLDATLAVTVELRKLMVAIRTESPAKADSALAKLGFLSPEPAHSDARTDDKHTLELTAAGVGLFTPALFCKPGTFANGFEQRVEPSQGNGDDTALNAVALLCADLQGTFVERLSVWEGVWGTWSTTSLCATGQFLTRGALKVEAPQLAGDSTSANAARFQCSDGTQLVANNDGAWGTWGGELACGVGEAVCGIETAYQAPQGDIDDVAMTGLRLHCCAIDNGAGGAAGSAGSAGMAGSGGLAGNAGMAGSGGTGGGIAGSAGMAGSAGTGGVAGAAGHGGTAGTGGAPTDAGNPDAGRVDNNAAEPSDPGGCTCESPRGRTSSMWGWHAMAGAIAIALRRPRRRLRHS